MNDFIGCNNYYNCQNIQDSQYIVNSGDVIFMVMADSDWAKRIYDEFVKYMDNKVVESLEYGSTLEELPDEYN